MGVVLALDAGAVPFGLGGFHDEGVEDGVFGGILVGVEPDLEEGEPVFFVFEVQDEGFGAHAVGGGVAGGGLTAGFAGRARSAGVSFLVLFVWIGLGGFGRIGVDFRWLSGFGEFVFEMHVITKSMVGWGVWKRLAKVM